MHTFGSRLPGAVFGSLGGLLIGLTFACGPTAAPRATPVAADPFAVVRATSEAAYLAGKDFLERGDLQGCPLIDLANTNDPDNRPEIQQALARCLTAIAGLPPAATSTPGQHPLVLATLPVVAPGLPVTATPALPRTQPSAAAVTSPAAGPQTTPTAQTLTAFSDPQGRFSISAPADWVTSAQPPALFGTGVVQFRDPSGRAELNVAVDSAARAVSPELYAASMDLAMQQQLPGYAAEQTSPGSTAGQPSIRRVFTFTQRDAAGQDTQARSFQVTVLKGSTPYLISGSAPAAQFEQYTPIFDQMVQSFRFS